MADTAEFDAAVSEAEETIDTLEFCGEQIGVKALPAIVLLKFAKFASRDIGTGDMEGMAAMYDMIRGVVLPHERDRFEQLATDNEVTGDQLMNFVVAVLQANTGRPTVPSSSLPVSASDGSPKSKSASAVVDLGDGRIVEIQPGETTARATARALLMDVPGEDELDGIAAATNQVLELED